jgi:hypothetical protein
LVQLAQFYQAPDDADEHTLHEGGVVGATRHVLGAGDGGTEAPQAGQIDSR